MKTEGRYETLHTTLQKQTRIDTLSLDPNHYTETLLSAAQNAGMYDDQTVMAVQSDLFSLLSERLMKMTDGESCSVPAETAQAVFVSVLYTLDQALLAIPSPDDAAMRLAQTSASVLYEDGLHRIKRRLAASELLYRKHLSLFRNLPDSVMKTTAIDGIAVFFRAYHPQGFADAVPITADYPLYLEHSEIVTLPGVNFLGRYLQGLIAEAKFLSKFRTETLEAVLSADDPLYRETPANLYAPMLATTLAMGLLRRPFSAWKYGLQREDMSALVHLHSVGLLNEPHLRTAAETVIDLLMLDDSTADYVRRSVPKLCDSIDISLKNGLPQRIFPCTDASCRQAFPSKPQLFYQGGRMDAEAFRCLDFDLRACSTPDEKTKLILSRIQGLEDLGDLLISDTGVLDMADKQHLTASLPIEARQILSELYGDELTENNNGDGDL